MNHNFQINKKQLSFSNSQIFKTLITVERDFKKKKNQKEPPVASKRLKYRMNNFKTT